MQEMILLKLGELVLKGLNRHSFEERLCGNLRRRIQGYGRFSVTSKQSTIYVQPLSDDCDLAGAFEACRYVFGVVALSRAYPCEKTKEAILEAAKTYLHDQLSTAKSFKVESKRADKRFPMTSIQLSQWVGGELDDLYPNLTVDVHDPELTVYVEVRENAAYVHGNPLPGAGGLPVSINGVGVSLLSGGIDSPVSSYMMAKRGLALDMVHFFSPPYTSDQAKEKVIELAKILTPYTGRTILHIIPFTEIQEEIRKNCPEEYFTLIMRRFMMRIADRIGERIGAGCIVTGECLGQVASQTMEALRSTEDACALPVFRPLIGMDKEEIVTISRKIGAFDTSILPYEDCCTVFTPRHPKTHPKIEDVAAAEAALPIAELVERALAGDEKLKLSW
jgi:thiamine biosynthesis protein ThiI